MTDRLRDLVATDDPAMAELARLVRAARDVDPRPGAQDRVRRALAERQTPRRRWQTRLVVALVLLIVPVAIAGVHRLVAPPPPPPPAIPSGAPGGPRLAPRSGAAIAPAPAPAVPARGDAGPEVARSSAPRPSPSPAAQPPVPPEPPSVLQRPAPVPAPPAPGAATPSTPETPVPTSEPRPGPRSEPSMSGPGPGASASGAPSRHRAVAAPSGSRLAIESTARSAPPPDAALVLDAMRRLRRGHDPRAALRDLDAYLDQFPDGDLAEEVLALAIEARAALGDAAACSLAEQYLQRYPHGRFRDPAEHIRLQLRGQDQRCPRGPEPALP